MVYSTLDEIVHQSMSSLQLISEETASHKPDPTKWSPKEILGHLVDSAANNHRRFKQSLYQEHLVFDGYNQDDEVKIHDYQHRSLAEVISLWYGMNRNVIQVLKAIPTDRLTQQYAQHNYHRIGFNRIPAEEPSTIEYLALDYIGHLEHHLAQIIPAYEKQLGDY